MAVRGLRLVVAMSGLGQPGQVHRARMGNRQPGPAQAGSGQEERESQDAALPEDSEHGAKLASAPLRRKREGLKPASGTFHQPEGEQGERHLSGDVNLPGPCPEARRVLGGIGLVGAELVEIVVTSHVLPGRKLVLVGSGAEVLRQAIERQQSRGGNATGRPDKLAAAPIQWLFGDL